MARMTRRRVAAIVVLLMTVSAILFLCGRFLPPLSNEIVVMNLSGESVPFVWIEFDDGRIIEFRDIQDESEVGFRVSPGANMHVLVTVQFLDGEKAHQNFGGPGRNFGQRLHIIVNQWSERKINGAGRKR